MAVQSKEALEAFQKLTCGQLYHTWTPHSCSAGSWKVFTVVWFRAAKLYGPLFFIPALLRRTPPSQLLNETLPSVVYSTTFLSSFISSLMVFVCTFRRVFGFQHPLFPYFAAYLASWSMFLERKSRRAELGVYICTQAAWCLFRKAEMNGWVKSVPFGEVMVYSLSLSILLPMLQSEPRNVGSTMRRMLGLLVTGENTTDDKVMQWVGKQLRAFLPAEVYNTALRASSPSAWTGITPQCEHDSCNCGWHALRSVFRGGIIGIALKAAFSIPSFVTGKQNIFRFLLSLRSWSYALAFGSLAGIFKATICFLRRYMETLSPVAAQRGAALLAGLSFVFWRSPSIAIYFLGKAVETLYRKAVADGHTYLVLPHGDILLYAFGVSILMQGALVDPAILPEAYWKFLNSMAGGLVGMINRDAFQTIGWGATAKGRRVLPLTCHPIDMEVIQTSD